MNRHFVQLLDDFGKEIDLILHPDKQEACSIYIAPITIQLQLDPTEENLFLFAKIGEIPPGRFRENLLKEALRSNGDASFLFASLGYIFRTNELALTQKHPLEGLTGPILRDFFERFYATAQEWYTLLKRR